MQKTKKLKKQRKHKGKGGTRNRGGTNPIKKVVLDSLLFDYIKSFIMYPETIYKLPGSDIEYKFIKETNDPDHGLTYEFIVNPGKINQYELTLHNLKPDEYKFEPSRPERRESPKRRSVASATAAPPPPQNNLLPPPPPPQNNLLPPPPPPQNNLLPPPSRQPL